MGNSIILKIIEAIVLNGDRGEVGAVFQKKKKNGTESDIADVQTDRGGRA